MDTIDRLKQELLAVCRVVVHQGLADAFAHVSARVPGAESMIFMPGKSPVLVTAEDLFIVGLDQPVEQSSMHQAIYRTRSDVKAVVHTHPPRAIALSVLGDTIRPIHNNSVMFCQGVPLYDTPGRVGGSEKGNEIASALGLCNAILLRGHGLITVAGNLRDACLLAIYLEETARMCIEVAPLGRAREIPNELAIKFNHQFFDDQSNQRAWDHFKHQAGVA